MGSLTIPSTGYRYGWSRDANSTAKQYFYMGRVNNGSSTRKYDASIKFTPDVSPWGNLPITVLSVTLKTQSFSGNPYNNLNIYLSTEENAWPGGYTLNPNESIGTFNDANVEITNSKALTEIASYLKNKTTFYLHITGDNEGGTIEGYNTTNKPQIEINWDYANSIGSLDKINFNCGEVNSLKLTVRGTEYLHDISCYLNNISEPINFYFNENLDNLNESKNGFSATLGQGQHSFFIKISPPPDYINYYFGTNITVSGYFLLTTKKNNSDTKNQIGDSVQIPFNLILTKEYCLESNYLLIEDSFCQIEERSGGENWPLVQNKSKVKLLASYDCPYSYSSAQLIIENSFLGKIVKEIIDMPPSLETPHQLEQEGIIIGAEALIITLRVTDTRGFVYLETQVFDAPVSYSKPILLKPDFYRSNGENKYLLGTKIGCSFGLAFSNINEENSITEVKVEYDSSNSETLKLLPLENKYISKNLFPEKDFLTTNSYTLKILVKDTISGDKNFNNSETENGYYSYLITIPKAEYIIHIPQGGNGIAFGTAYTEDNKPYVEMGWELKLKEPLAVKYGGTGVNNFDSSNYLSISNNTITLQNDTPIIAGTDPQKVILKSSPSVNDSSQNVIDLGNESDILNLHGDTIKYSIKGKTYFLPPFIYAKEGTNLDDGTGTGFPEGYDENNTLPGMIWLKII